jgi:hypothetical protein
MAAVLVARLNVESDFDFVTRIRDLPNVVEKKGYLPEEFNYSMQMN